MEEKLRSLAIDYSLIPSLQVSFSTAHSAEIAQEGGTIYTEVAKGLNNVDYALFNASFHTICQPVASRAVPSQPCLLPDPPVAEERSYDRPGKKPAAAFQRDPLELEKSCRRAGGSTFAVDSIVPTFKYGVTTEALLRHLKREEIDEMKFAGGFEPHQAYDRFISKVGERYVCGLCKEGKNTRWKYKKDAPRHLRKFHFGLADVCKDW